MNHLGIFPFGQPVQPVIQQDRSPKAIFVLGVYASAVHARWINQEGKELVKALAVASEPYIFWKGDGAEKIIRQIPIHPQYGCLEPANSTFNGPSGIALDNLILEPAGYSRTQAWLCDLVPYSCANKAQQRAIEKHYWNLEGLPKPSVPELPRCLADDQRRKEILAELFESQAETLILLGDQPIYWFLSFFDSRWKRLADYGRQKNTYGQLHLTHLKGKAIQVLPLAHPRQIAKLGRSSQEWYDLHKQWIIRNENNRQGNHAES